MIYNKKSLVLMGETFFFLVSSHFKEILVMEVSSKKFSNFQARNIYPLTQQPVKSTVPCFLHLYPKILVPAVMLHCRNLSWLLILMNIVSR